MPQPQMQPARPKGRRYPADPPRVEEIIAVMRRAGNRPHGLRAKALIVVLWRAGLRISEALALTGVDLEPGRGALLVRCAARVGASRGRHGRTGVGLTSTPGSDFAEIFRWAGCSAPSTRRDPGVPCSPTAIRVQLRRLAAAAGVRRRFAPHQLRHAHAVELARVAGIPLNVIQRQLGHANLGVTSIYLQGIDNAEVIEAVNSRRAPMIPAAAALDR